MLPPFRALSVLAQIFAQNHDVLRSFPAEVAAVHVHVAVNVPEDTLRSAA